MPRTRGVSILPKFIIGTKNKKIGYLLKMVLERRVNVHITNQQQNWLCPFHQKHNMLNYAQSRVTKLNNKNLSSFRKKGKCSHHESAAELALPISS